MKTIKIQVIDLPGGTSTKGTYRDSWHNNVIVEALKKHYNVVQSENPDYLFFSGFSSYNLYKYLKCDCVRIFFAFENIRPNFNICDYAIGLFDMEYEDRYLRLPPQFADPASYSDYNAALIKHTFTIDDLKKKRGFCARVVSNAASANSVREEFFNLLSEKYKMVDSGGSAANNIGYRVLNKQEFLCNYKFSLAFENSMYYVTEKIVDAFGAKTIPIYWGDPNVGRDFNTKAFINCHEYDSLEKVIERIKEIDNNDEFYLDMMREIAFVRPISLESHQERLEKFLINIIEKEKVEAKQRDTENLYMYDEEVSKRMAIRRLGRKHLFLRFLTYIYNPFRPLLTNKLGMKIRKFIIEILGITAKSK